MEHVQVANPNGNDQGENLENEEINSSRHDSSLLSKKINKKKVYLKLDKAQLKSLKESFVLTEFYPKKSQINRLADELHIDVTKIENWLKYERRKLAKMTVLQKYKKRKRFSESDLEYLRGHFQENINPSKNEIEQMAETINCMPKNIENWFGNYKKKIKSQSKSSTNSQKSKRTQILIPMSPKNIKIEESLNTTQQNDSFQANTPSNSNDCSPNNQNLNHTLGFFQSLQNYLSNPEVLEMQRKNIALTQNFMVYQQRYQAYLMMHFKNLITKPSTNVPVAKIEENEEKIDVIQQKIDENIKKNEEQIDVEKEEKSEEQKLSLGAENQKEMPKTFNNMINFLQNCFKEKVLR